MQDIFPATNMTLITEQWYQDPSASYHSDGQTASHLQCAEWHRHLCQQEHHFVEPKSGPLFLPSL